MCQPSASPFTGWAVSNSLRKDSCRFLAYPNPCPGSPVLWYLLPASLFPSLLIQPASWWLLWKMIYLSHSPSPQTSCTHSLSLEPRFCSREPKPHVTKWRIPRHLSHGHTSLVHDTGILLSYILRTGEGLARGCTPTQLRSI